MRRPALAVLVAPLAPLACVVALSLPAGCNKESAGPSTTAPSAPSTPAAAAPAADMAATTYKGVALQYPKDWTATPQGTEGLDIRPPAGEEEFPPGLYIEAQPAAGDTKLDEALTTAVDHMRSERTGFHLRKKEVLTSPAGFKYGRIEYDVRSNEQADELTKWELLIPMAGNQQLVVQASSLTKTWPQYQPAFARIIDSIRLPATGG